MLHPVHFRLALVVDLGCGYITSPGSCLQTVRTDTGRRVPLVAIYAAWRPDEVLYGSYTIGIYNDDAVLRVFNQDSRSWRRSEIEEFLVVQWTNRALCVAVSALEIETHT